MIAFEVGGPQQVAFEVFGARASGSKLPAKSALLLIIEILRV